MDVTSMISQLSLFKKKNKTSVENSIAVVGVTKALLIGRPPLKPTVPTPVLFLMHFLLKIIQF